MYKSISQHEVYYAHISTWSILCTYLNMKYIMHISQHEVYYAHISTWSILCTYLNMKYIMYISQHEVYYAHISTWSILCTYLNMKYVVVVPSNLILAKRTERPNHLIELASIKSSIWYEGCKTIEGKGHMTGMKIMSFWVPNTEYVSRKHSVRITWQGSMSKIFNNYHSPLPSITRISVWAMIDS